MNTDSTEHLQARIQELEKQLNALQGAINLYFTENRLITAAPGLLQASLECAESLQQLLALHDVPNYYDAATTRTVARKRLADFETKYNALKD